MNQTSINGTGTGLLHARALSRLAPDNLLDQSGLDGWSFSEGPVWAHFDRRSDQTRRWLAERSGLDATVLDAMLAEDTRPRLLTRGEGAVVILRGVNLNPGAEPDDMISLRMWVDGDRLISMRFPKLAAVNDVKNQVDERRVPTTPGRLLAELALALADRMAPVIGNIRELLDDFEDRALDGDVDSVQSELGPIRRQIITIRRYLAPQHEVLYRSAELDARWLGDEARVMLNEAADRTRRFTEDLDALRDRAVFIQEELMARQSQQMNKTMYLLSMVATVFLPLGFVTGLLGINVAGMPGTDWSLAFWVVVGLLVVLTGVELWLIRRWGLLNSGRGSS
ncbi:CorA family divalent cation transporter [Mucisphaera sp.]|uniref:CorA family divalent cation transporter n=1 Tax=Mucisphaera sp. TaxID=2913024 RepID=UPI003D09FE02